jgi:hypothetical protein
MSPWNQIADAEEPANAAIRSILRDLRDANAGASRPIIVAAYGMALAEIRQHIEDRAANSLPPVADFLDLPADLSHRNLAVKLAADLSDAAGEAGDARLAGIAERLRVALLAYDAAMDFWPEAPTAAQVESACAAFGRVAA